MRISPHILASIYLVIACTAMISCRQPIGRCTYGTVPEPALVAVTSVTSVFVHRKPYRVIRVKEFPKVFYLSEEEYRQCFINAGYRIGSKIKGSVLHGGPCPPFFYRELCDKVQGVFDTHR